MELQPAQRSLAIVGANLLLSAAAYYTVSRYHLIPAEGLNKYVCGITASILLQATLPYVAIPTEPTERKPALIERGKRPIEISIPTKRDITIFLCKRDITTFLILGVGAWWAGATYKTIALSALVLGALQGILSTAIALYEPISFSNLSFSFRDDSVEPEQLIAEARQLLHAIPEYQHLMPNDTDDDTLASVTPPLISLRKPAKITREDWNDDSDDSIEPEQLVAEDHQLFNAIPTYQHSAPNGTDDDTLASVTLRDLAEINIIVAESREDWNAAYNKVQNFQRSPLLQIRLLTQLALTQPAEHDENPLQETFNLAKSLKNKSEKCAAYVAIALVQKKLNQDYSDAKDLAKQAIKPEAEDETHEPKSWDENELERSNLRLSTEDHWIAGIEKEEAEIQQFLDTPEGLSPIGLAEYHLRHKNYIEALKASHQEKWNLYWRIEFLCNLHGVLHAQQKLQSQENFSD